MRVNVIGKSNGVGLSRDLTLLADVLRACGCEVAVLAVDSQTSHSRRSLLSQVASVWRYWRQKHVGGGRQVQADINVMMEHLWPESLPTARFNVAVPNPEWFDRHDQRLLPFVDRVWAKTQNTQRIFQRLRRETSFIGFDSEDRLDSTVLRQRKFFHLAGKSTMKGTRRLLEVWCANPQWPTLMVVQHTQTDPDLTGANIEYRLGYMDDAELRRLQNQNLFHVCTSETEGWGHYLIEAMSVGAIALTLDAPPMNELLTPERGLLLRADKYAKQKLADCYRFDADSLAAAVERLSAMSDVEIERLGTAARQWFIDNKTGFYARVNGALAELSMHKHSSQVDRHTMKTSLIITTYNWKEALELVFRSIARQVEMPDEILVADDGSGADTAELIARWATRLPVPVRHIWQEDLGFRLARSRNRAIAAAIGDYIIIVDGDTVLHSHFVADHKRAARRGYFIQGVRLLTQPQMGQRMLSEGLLDVGFFAPHVRRRRHTVRNRLLSWLLFQQVHDHQKAIRGSNQAYWKADLLKVNGFDERMLGWGREDNEIAQRLYNVGIKRRNLKFAALTTHIYHHQRKPTGDNPNDRYLRETITNKRTSCELGINQYLSDTHSL